MAGRGFFEQMVWNDRGVGHVPKRVRQEQLIKGFNKLKAELEAYTHINIRILHTGECSS